MPELPEVEVTKNGLQAELPGHAVLDLYWSGKKLRHSMPLARLRQHILKQIFTRVDRRAKYLLFRMENKATLLIHLGMTGKLGIHPADSPRHQHDHLALRLDDNRELRFNDARRFGVVQVWPPEEAGQMEKDLCEREGMEPFGPDFTSKNLFNLACNRRVAIKSLLMDSHLIAGIGNIYANEILFAAKIQPERLASSLNPAEWRRIVLHSHRILRRAIEAGGSTIADFLNASGHPGYFQFQFQVYGKAGLPCPRCSAILQKIPVNARSSFFCPVCQI